jgi:hypothetical protein
MYPIRHEEYVFPRPSVTLNWKNLTAAGLSFLIKRVALLGEFGT